MKMERDEEGNVVLATGRVSELRIMNLWMECCCVSVWGEKNGSRVHKAAPMGVVLKFWEWVNTKQIEA